jgi:hypothetical protein
MLLVATRAAEAKKVTKAKKAAVDPADVASSRGQATPVKKSASATASAAGPAAGGEALASATEALLAKKDAESIMERDPEAERPIAPPEVEKEPIATEEGGSSAVPLRERQTKAARDPLVMTSPSHWKEELRR